MTILIGIGIALLICAIYGVIRVMLAVAHLRGYLEALQDERRNPDSTPCVGSGE